MRSFRKSTRLKLAAALGAVALLASSAVPAARFIRSWRRRVRIEQLARAAPNTLEGFELEPDPDPDAANEEGERDDPTLRKIAMRAYYGDATPEALAQHLSIARSEAQKWKA